MRLTRRKLFTSAVAGALTGAVLPRMAIAKTPTTIQWDDLIPPGIPYAEIIAEGKLDAAKDTWRPVFDSNATKLNPALDGAYIKMPGFIIPIEMSQAGVTSFVLVPYVGACIHTPPPPPNQLVFVTTETPYPKDKLWEAVWVTGEMSHEIQSTDVAETGYVIKADLLEMYVW